MAIKGQLKEPCVNGSDLYLTESISMTWLLHLAVMSYLAVVILYYSFVRCYHKGCGDKIKGNTGYLCIVSYNCM